MRILCVTAFHHHVINALSLSHFRKRSVSVSIFHFGRKLTQYQFEKPSVPSIMKVVNIGKVEEMSSNKISDFSGTDTYCWTIESFSALKLKDEIYSSEFFEPRDKRLGKSWFVAFDFIGSPELSIEAFRPPPEGTSIKCVFSLTCSDKRASATVKFSRNEIGPSGGYVLCRAATDFWGSTSNTITRSGGIGKLTVSFSVTYQLPKKKLHELTNLARDLGVLWREKRSADMVVSVKGAEDIPAHTAILSARSKVFAAMFEHDMSEKRTRRVEIDDFEPDVVKALLDFMYCANIDDDMDVSLAFELQRAADKYDVPDLRNACSDFLISRIDKGNAIGLAIAADASGAFAIKAKATKFICNNYEHLDFQKNRDMIGDDRFSAVIDIMESLQKHFSAESSKK